MAESLSYRCEHLDFSLIRLGKANATLNETQEKDDSDSEHLKPLLMQMKDFSLLEPFPESWPNWTGVNLNEEFPNPEYLQITLILSTLTSPVRIGEKTRWAYGFIFKGVPCVISLQKFGLRLYVRTEKVATQEAKNADVQGFLIAALRKAVKYVKRQYISAFFEEISESDTLVLRNDYHPIRNMYQYFRDAAAGASETHRADDSESIEGVRESEVPILGSTKEFLAPWFEDRERFRNKGYYEFAAVLAFFSLIEHVLVLLVSLSSSAFDQPLAGFIKMELKAKLNVIFVKGDPDSDMMRSKLLAIADKYRNFFAHGGITKGGRATHVHLKGIGPVANPAFKLNRDPSLPFIEFLPNKPTIDSEVFPFFDEFEKWLAQGPTRFEMKFINDGMDILYDKKFLVRFLEACSDESTFDDWLRERSLATDRLINFESW